MTEVTHTQEQVIKEMVKTDDFTIDSLTKITENVTEIKVIVVKYDEDLDEVFEKIYYIYTNNEYYLYVLTYSDEIPPAFANNRLYYRMLKGLGWEKKIEEINKKFIDGVILLLDKLTNNQEIKQAFQKYNITKKIFEIQTLTDGFNYVAYVVVDREKDIEVATSKEEYMELRKKILISYIDFNLGMIDYAAKSLAKWLYERNMHVIVNDVCVPCYLYCKDEVPCADGVHCDGSCGGR